jgi:hypothetical protein
MTQKRPRSVERSSQLHTTAPIRQPRRDGAPVVAAVSETAALQSALQRDAMDTVPFDVVFAFDHSITAVARYVSPAAPPMKRRVALNVAGQSFDGVTEAVDAMVRVWRVQNRSAALPPGLTPQLVSKSPSRCLLVRAGGAPMKLDVALGMNLVASGGAVNGVQCKPSTPSLRLAPLALPVAVHYRGMRRYDAYTAQLVVVVRHVRGWRYVLQYDGRTLGPERVAEAMREKLLHEGTAGGEAGSAGAATYDWEQRGARCWMSDLVVGVSGGTHGAVVPLMSLLFRGALDHLIVTPQDF